MEENTPPQRKPLIKKEPALPTSAYWSLEVETDGRPTTYQFSPVIEAITGFKYDYFSSSYKKWLGVVHPEDRQGVFDFFSELMTQEGEGVVEYRIIRPDGIVRWVSDSAASQRLPDQSMRVDGAVSDITERKQAEEVLKRSNQQLAVWIDELQARRNKMEILEHITNALQPCGKLDEVFGVLAKYIEDVFPNQRGALYLFNVSTNTLQQVVIWGEFNGEPAFAPETCHAWQSGKPHVSPGTRTKLLCKHDQKQARDETLYLCAPLVAQGQRVGVLYLQRGVNDFEAGSAYDSVEFWTSMAMMITERLAFVILNLKLRQDLENQSVHDALTGLHIRRYFEESLQSEIQRAARYKRPLGLIIADVDHLKDINETIGHSAGNAVLQTLGKFFLSQIRGSDVACHYEDDSFTILLSEASLEDTIRRAEKLQQDSKKLRIISGDRPLKTMTLSIGVAAFPQHGKTWDLLLEAAKQALATAKEEGRDQVRVAEISQ